MVGVAGPGKCASVEQSIGAGVDMGRKSTGRLRPSGDTPALKKKRERKGNLDVQAEEDEAQSPESPPDPQAGAAPSTPGELPISGIRVIDVGNFLAGPYAASIMGEFGAEVLKVEHPIAGDPMRRFGTPTTATMRRSPGSARPVTRSR